jgi:hypothetical protein
MPGSCCACKFVVLRLLTFMFRCRLCVAHLLNFYVKIYRSLWYSSRKGFKKIMFDGEQFLSMLIG